MSDLGLGKVSLDRASSRFCFWASLPVVLCHLMMIDDGDAVAVSMDPSTPRVFWLGVRIHIDLISSAVIVS